MPLPRIAGTLLVVLLAATACATAQRTASPDTHDPRQILAALDRAEEARWAGVRAVEMTVRAPMGEAVTRLVVSGQGADRRVTATLLSVDAGFPAPPEGMEIEAPISGPVGWGGMEAAEVRWEGREERDGRLLERIVLIDPVEPEVATMPGLDLDAIAMTTSRKVLLVDREDWVVPYVEAEGEATNPETGVRNAYRSVQTSSGFREDWLGYPQTMTVRMEGLLPAEEVAAMRGQMTMLEGMVDQVPAEDRPMIEAMIRMTMEMFQEDGAVEMTTEILDVTVEREG